MQYTIPNEQIDITSNKYKVWPLEICFLAENGLKRKILLNALSQKQDDALTQNNNHIDLIIQPNTCPYLLFLYRILR